MKDDYDSDSVLSCKAEIYFQKGKAVHIEMKKAGQWFNGIIEEWSVDHFTLMEFKLGEMIFFYSDIENIESYYPNPKAKELAEDNP